MLGILSKGKAIDASQRRTLFESLMEQTQRQAYSLAYRLTGNPSEAEDLCQETYIRAYRFFHRYDESLPFANWLYRIMSNAHIDLMRRKGRLKTTSLEQNTPSGVTTIEVPDYDSSPDKAVLEDAMGEHLQNALQTMTPEFRTAVLLADVEGMAYEEIADAMKTSVGTVRSRIHRGRKQLRRYLLRHAPKTYGGLE